MSQELTPIVPVSKTETRDYSDRNVTNIWIERQVLILEAEVSNDFSQRISELIIQARQTICLMIHGSCVELLNHELLTHLSKRIEENKIRTYILCDDLSLFEEDVFNHVLLRKVSDLPEGIMILTDTHSETAGFLASGSLGFSLSNEQINSLFMFFCEQFWKNAEMEKISGIEKLITNNENISQKLLIKPKDDSILGLNLREGQFSKAFLGDSIPPIVKVKEELLTSLAVNVMGYDCKAIRADNRNQSVPFALMLNDASSYFSIKYGKQWFTLKPTSGQVKQAEVWFKKQFDQASFEWSNEIIRKDLVDKSFYQPSNLHDKLRVKVHSTKTMEDIHFDLNDSNIKSQDSLDLIRPKEEQFEDDGFSLTIEYSWELIPPKLPKSAKIDGLYKEWEKYQQVTETDEQKNKAKHSPQALPSIGELFSKDGKRFIKIQNWEDLREAQEEAKRFFNATIVV